MYLQCSKENTACHIRPRRSCTYIHSEGAGAAGGRLCRMKGVSDPWSHWRIWLACLNNFMEWQGNETCYDSGVSESSKMKKSEFRAKRIKVYADIFSLGRLCGLWLISNTRDGVRTLWEGPSKPSVHEAWGLSWVFYLSKPRRFKRRKWAGTSQTLTYFHIE